MARKKHNNTTCIPSLLYFSNLSNMYSLYAAIYTTCLVYRFMVGTADIQINMI